MTDQELDERVARAVDNFMQGYGCCQSVVAAFADLYGLDETMAKKIAAGFGGGVGRMRMMCGTVSGIVMLTGLDCGQTEGSDREGKSACYKVVQDLLAKSKADNGSLICAEILGLKGYEKASCSYVASERTAEYYKKRPCAAKVESANVYVRMTEEDVYGKSAYIKAFQVEDLENFRAAEKESEEV